YRASRPHMAQLGRVPGTHIFRNIKRFKDLEIMDHLLIVRIDGPIYFANVEYIRDKMGKWLDERSDKTKMIIFNMESVTSLDSTGAHEMYEWIINWRKNNIDVCITGTKGPVRDVLSKWNLIECIGADHVFMDDHTATTFFEQSLDAKSMEKHTSYALQNNLGKK
ncbi:MAG: STAS domain-containing protein, partial [Cyclobacteriaceae bacterium]